MSLLGTAKLFTGICETVASECAAQFTVLRVGRRRRLYIEGQPAAQLYCLLDGLVRIGRLSEDGLDLTLRMPCSGDIFGEEALFRQSAHSTSATALTDCTIAVAPADCVKSMLLRYPPLAMNVARCLRDYHERTVDRFQKMAFRRVRYRLVALLHELATRCGVEEPNGTRIEAVLTHAELASLIGATRETVTFELNELARTGRILRRGRNIVVRQARLAEGAA